MASACITHFVVIADFSVFVGDLAPDVTDYVLQETFRQYYPSVRSAKVSTRGGHHQQLHNVGTLSVGKTYAAPRTWHYVTYTCFSWQLQWPAADGCIMFTSHAGGQCPTAGGLSSIPALIGCSPTNRPASGLVGCCRHGICCNKWPSPSVTQGSSGSSFSVLQF